MIIFLRDWLAYFLFVLLILFFFIDRLLLLALLNLSFDLIDLLLFFFLPTSLQLFNRLKFLLIGCLNVDVTLSLRKFLFVNMKFINIDITVWKLFDSSWNILISLFTLPLLLQLTFYER